MTWRIILWGSLIWLPFLICKILGGEARFTKNIAVGVTLPFDGRSDPEVQERLSRFKHELKLICTALVIAAIPCIFIKNLSASFTVFLIWTDLCIILPYIPYLRCNRDLKRIKLNRGWRSGSAELRSVDLSAVQEPRELPLWSFVPAVLLSLFPLLLERSLWPLYIANMLGALFCLLCYRWAYRRRAELVDADTELTNALTRIRRRSWERMWLITAYGLGAISPLVMLTRNSPTTMLCGIMALCALMVIAAVRIELKTRALQAKLSSESGSGWYADEDDKWLGGVLYYDPNDSRTIVNCRVGINTTVNLAQPGGRVLSVLIAMLLLALPFTGLIIDSATNKAVSLEVSDTQLIAHCGKGGYEIALDDIAEAELINELPQHLVRSFGTNAPHLLKGNFSAAGYGSLRMCLDPTCAPFLYIETTEGVKYILGSQNPGEAELVLASLKTA